MFRSINFAVDHSICSDKVSDADLGELGLESSIGVGLSESSDVSREVLSADEDPGEGCLSVVPLEEGSDDVSVLVGVGEGVGDLLGVKQALGGSAVSAGLSSENVHLVLREDVLELLLSGGSEVHQGGLAGEVGGVGAVVGDSQALEVEVSVEVEVHQSLALGVGDVTGVSLIVVDNAKFLDDSLGEGHEVDLVEVVGLHI